MKSLDALEELKKQFGNLCFHLRVFKNDETFEDKTFNYNEIYFDLIEKELKALEIIKNKNVDIDWYCGLASFTPHHDVLTDEEYDLLKEVLL